MVNLVEDLDMIPNLKISCTVAIQNLYAFALNRRNKNGDRAKALDVILKVSVSSNNHHDKLEREISTLVHALYLVL